MNLKRAKTPALPESSRVEGRYAAQDFAKLRGGYYTAPLIAEWLSAWAIQSSANRVLEPSCGDGVFLAAAAKRLLDLGARKQAVIAQLCAVEIDGHEAGKASSRLADVVGTAGAKAVVEKDFFDWWNHNHGQSFDAVIGNPPFIRYQSFPALPRDRAMSIMAQLGLKANRLTNIWVPFVVAATECLKPGGRMAMVLPAELLQVTYAGQLRSYLVDRFERIDVIACNDLLFANAEQEVVLLLADIALPKRDESNTCRVALTEAKSAKEIIAAPASALLKKAEPKVVKHDNEKWLKYFLSQKEIDFMRRLRDGGTALPLSAHATVDVGVVTGKNEFFVLSQDQVTLHGLKNYVEPLVGRSAHLRGATISDRELKAMAAAGERVFLFRVESGVNGSLSAAGKKYVRFGEEQRFNEGYKCSIRSPWYVVPSVWQPDCFFFRQIYDFPRVVVNHARATSTDTIHRLRFPGDPDKFAASVYSHLTAASAEIEGRSYGGGVLELEPTEAERILLPSILGTGLPISECDSMIRAGRLQDVLDANDQLILIEQLGMSKRDVAMLRAIWEKMRNRRMARSKKANPANS